MQEQDILTHRLALGRTCLEHTLAQQAQHKGSAARREGSCGHRQRLVSTRPRHVVTLLGPMAFHRASDQWVRKDEHTVDQKEKPLVTSRGAWCLSAAVRVDTNA